MKGFPEHAIVYEKVLNLAQDIKENGGRGLLVGGSVRDHVMGKIAKDFDLEVYGLEPAKIEEIVEKHGN